MPELWSSGQLRAAHKKELLRSLIRRIIVKRPVPARLEVQIVWVSGASSQHSVRPGLQSTADLEEYERLLERLRELSSAGYDDGVIAERLAEEGFRGARSEHLSADTVGKLRRQHKIISLRATYRQQAQIDGQWTVAGLIRELGVNRRRVYELIERGVVPARQDPQSRHYLIPDDPEVLALLKGTVASSVPRVKHVDGHVEGGAADAEEPEPAHD